MRGTVLCGTVEHERRRGPSWLDVEAPRKQYGDIRKKRICFAHGNSQRLWCEVAQSRRHGDICLAVAQAGGDALGGCPSRCSRTSNVGCAIHWFEMRARRGARSRVCSNSQRERHRRSCTDCHGRNPDYASVIVPPSWVPVRGRCPWWQIRPTASPEPSGCCSQDHLCPRCVSPAR